MREEALPIGHRSFGVSSDISGMACGAWRLGRVGGVGGEPSVVPWLRRGCARQNRLSVGIVSVWRRDGGAVDQPRAPGHIPDRDRLRQ